MFTSEIENQVALTQHFDFLVLYERNINIVFQKQVFGEYENELGYFLLGVRSLVSVNPDAYHWNLSLDLGLVFLCISAESD